MVPSLLPDLSPLRDHPAFRHLWTGFTLSGIGSQLATVTIGLQVYDLTGSTAAVGVVGFFALVPLVVLGLYGGSLADHHDRRTVAMISTTVAWVTSVACAIQAWVGVDSVWLLYVLVAVWNGAFAVTSPARTSIYPRILPAALLPAANALGVLAMSTSMLLGPLLAGFLVDAGGFRLAYTLDVFLTLGALWGLGRLGPIPPLASEGDASHGRAGIASVLDGFRFLRTAPNVRMTFVADIAAMVLAQPRVLFPAAGAVILGGGARTVGLLYAAAAAGSVLASALSGRLGSVRLQGRAIMISIIGWGVGIVGLGVALLAAGGWWSRESALIAALVAMVVAGASDAVSAVFRQTILQSAAPDRMRGRLQGVFIVVVAGGPRVGEILGGGVAHQIGEGWTAVVGGLACVAAIGVLSVRHRSFLAYDARHPTP